jgi:eukaryotic-like serine/threonine-protein kinase
MTQCDQCDRDLLRRLLDESLPDAVESDASLHVASCPTCQLEFEALAAGRGWWDEASQRLSRLAVGWAPGPPGLQNEIGSNGENISRCEDGRAGNPSYERASHDDASHFATDFAVDFLEPSDDSAMLGRLGDYEIVEVIGRIGPHRHRHRSRLAAGAMPGSRPATDDSRAACIEWRMGTLARP